MIKKIKVHLINSSVGLKIFNFLMSKLQSENNNQLPISIEFVDADHKFTQEADTVHVLFASMPEQLSVNTSDYDVVLFSNADEPLSVSTEVIASHITKPNCYLISNSLLTENHALWDSVIPVSHDLFLCVQYWLNPSYPQYYSLNDYKKYNRSDNFIFINGENRSWRKYVQSLLSEAIPEIKVISNISDIISETKQSAWESQEDSVFREFVNTQYNAVVVDGVDHCLIGDIEVGLGIDFAEPGIENRVGFVSPGYFVMPEYHQYKCVMFPETQWQNNEVALTEKILKCCVSRAIPWPVGGANINKIYNQHGFRTAWNLLPTDLREYDSELDHCQRHKKMILAMKWLHNNSYVLYSSEANELCDYNYHTFLDNRLFEHAVSKLRKAIKI